MPAQSFEAAAPARPAFQFSKTAEAVLQRAHDLAVRSGRSGVTSSGLLFAFADVETVGRDTARFVRDALNRRPNYREALQDYLAESGDAARQSASAVEGLSWRMSRNTLGVLEHAEAIATRVRRSREIHNRHLFAALLTAPEVDGPPYAMTRLKRMGVSVPALIEEFREFLRDSGLDDDERAWDSVLGTGRPRNPPAPPPTPPGSISLEEAEHLLGLDKQAINLLVNVSATARQLERPVDSFATLVQLAGWAAHDRLYAASAILRALAEQKGGATGTPWRTLLGLPDDFTLPDPDPSPSVRVSDELVAVLRATHNCVQRLGEPGFLRFRVLLAVVLSKGEAARGYAAPAELARLDYQVGPVRAFYRRWLADNREGDSAAVYDELLGPLSKADGPPPLEEDRPPESHAAPYSLPRAVAFSSTYPAYSPDRADFGRDEQAPPLGDELGVGAYADHLAQLVAAKDTSMPLSVGLFGAWGAGKSYFMDLLDERIRALTKKPGRVFHERIVQIRFNAWHYLDTNLWANLVCEIFDQLFVKLDNRKYTKKEQVDKLKEELAKQGGLAAEAREALKVAEAARVEAEATLRTAVRERAVEEGKVGALLNDLTKLAVDDDARDQLRAAADRLGLPKLKTSFAELEARAAEMRTLAGRTRAVVLAAVAGPGWWWRGLLLLAAALAAPAGVALLARDGPEWVQKALEGAGRTVAQVAAAVTALCAWLAAQARAGATVVTNLEAAYDKVKKVRAAREAEDDAARAQRELAVKRQAEEAARHTLREAEEKMKAISAELAELAPGRQLIRFLKDRAGAEDYRRHLGLVSLVRKDFEQLSRLLADRGEAPDPALPRLDRIVLYIDDLDRCRADRVVEVLEAVHLLLAFPLFAVVVAVDPRWLRQSLLDHYPRLLDGADGAGGPARPQRLWRPATPQDYLEKVFQVPFNLQTMEKPGFDALVRRLLPVAGAAVPPVPPPADPQPPGAHNPEVAQSGEAGSGGPPPVPPPADSQPTEPTAPEVARTGDAVPPVPPEPTASEVARTGDAVPPVPPAPPPPEAPPPPDPQRLALTEQEVEDMLRFQPLFQTPRAVKRLANTYCLVRVGVGADDWDDYLGRPGAPGAYRVPMLLLAVCSAFPALARPWLHWLLESPSGRWDLSKDWAALAAKNPETTAAADWELLGRCLGRLDLRGWAYPEPAQLAKWVRRVGRYSF